MTSTLLNQIALGGLAIVWLIYLIEAFRTSVRQGLLCLLPPYILYFAFIRSLHGRPVRWTMIVLILLWRLP